MRCEDCLPLIEEYFDKETDARTAEQMGAHVVRLERRSVVHVAADVEVPVVDGAADFLQRDGAGVADFGCAPDFLRAAAGTAVAPRINATSANRRRIFT